VFDAAKDTYLVTTLNDIQSKLDCIMRVVSRLSNENMPSAPELPSNVVLPIQNADELAAVEHALSDGTSVKDSMVSSLALV